MYTLISVISSVIVTLLITWLFAKLRIFDLIGYMIGCGTFALFRFLEVIAIFALTFYIVSGMIDRKVKKVDLSSTYLTTKTPLPFYEKIEKNPYDKESGIVSVDSVLKVIRTKKMGTVTWLESYILSDNKPRHIFVLIPSAPIYVKQDTDYFYFNEKSKSFYAYYKQIDDENMKIEFKIQNEYLQELNKNNIEVEHSSDNVLRESIKDTCYFIPINGFLEQGYFGAFKSEDSGEFYYIKKEYKKNFKKITYNYYNKFNKEKKAYF